MAGNSVIGALRVTLGLDTAQFETGLKQSQSNLAGFAKSAQVAATAAAAALAAGAVAMGAAVKAAVDRADELSKAAQKLGVGVEELSRLAHAADLSDVSLEQLSTAFRQLSANMSEFAGGGTNKAASAFKALGISVTDASGGLRSGSAVMTEIAERFAGMEDGAGKTALAMAIFGESGAQLIPMLNAGRDGLAEMMAEADQLGLTLNENTARAAEAFNDNLTRLRAAGTGVATQITAGLLPGLESLSETFVSGAKNVEFMSQVTAVLNGVLKGLSVAGVVVGAVFDATFKTVGATATAIKQILAGDLSGAMTTLNRRLDSFDGIAERISKAWNATGSAVSGAAQKVGSAAPVIAAAGNKVSKSLSEQEKAHKAAKEEIERYLATIAREQQTAGLSGAQVKILDAQAMALKAIQAGYTGAAAAILRYADALIEAEKIQRKVVETSADIVRDGQAVAREANEGIEETARRARQAIDDLPYAIDDVWYALKNKDWASALDGLKYAVEGVEFAFSSMGTTADKVNAVAGIANGVGQLIGGKAGKALSSAAFGAQIGMTFGGPIGAGIGALLGGVGSLLGGKKSNEAAIAQISGDSFRVVGDKRTDQTTQAATGVAQSLIAAQKLLQEAGISLSKSVTAIDIGTRDMTHIFLSTGEELRSAVGDPAAAAETALRALLSSASFASEAQQKLVESMLAAGKGFDEITAGLEAYVAAQAIPGQIADAILALTDPEAFEKEMLRREQQARRDSIKAAADAGYLTAEAFAAVSEQLSRLEGLELDQVLAKYAEAVDDAAESLEQQQARAAQAVDKARADLAKAFEGQAAPLREVISRFGSVAQGLRRFEDDLRRQTARSPQASLALARAAFQELAGRTDAESLAKLEDVGRAYIEAARSGASSADELAFVQAQVRAAALAGASSAEQQAGAAERQLAGIQAQVDALLMVNESTLTLTEAMEALRLALVNQARVNTTTPATANDNFDAARYLAANPDLQANWDAGGILRELGSDILSAVAQHWLQQGQFEIAAGLRPKFATGGGFKVGGYGGTDSKIVSMYATPNEYVNVSRADSMGQMAASIGRLEATVARQAADLAKTAKATDQMNTTLTRVSRDGQSLVTTAA